MQRIQEALIFNDPAVAPSHPVMLCVYKEFCRAFEDRGIPVRVIEDASQLHDNAIVFVGGYNEEHPNPAEVFMRYAPNATYCLWYWTSDKQVASLKEAPLKRVIHIHENMFIPSSDVLAVKRNKHTCPLLLRACEKPENVGTYRRGVMRDYFYAGFVYYPDQVPNVPDLNGIYHARQNASDYLDYDTRRNLYLSSHFALGWQGPENLETKHVSQRIYEGLAYGCIVLTNSDAAVEQTEGICVKVSSQEDVIAKMRWFKQNVGELKRRQALGYDFIRRSGTNHHALDTLLDVVRTLPE